MSVSVSLPACLPRFLSLSLTLSLFLSLSLSLYYPQQNALKGTPTLVSCHHLVLPYLLLQHLPLLVLDLQRKRGGDGGGETALERRESALRDGKGIGYVPAQWSPVCESTLGARMPAKQVRMHVLVRACTLSSTTLNSASTLLYASSSGIPCVCVFARARAR